MKKAFRIFLCLIGGLFILQFSASAVNITDVTVDAETNIVTIKGKVESNKTGQDVALQILNPDKKIEDFKIEHPEQAIAFFNRLWQTKTKDGGLFEFKYRISDSTDQYGEFTVRISSAGGPTQSGKFKYFSKAALDQLLLDINGCVPNENLNNENIEKLTSIITDKSDMFVSYFEPFSVLKEAGKITPLSTQISFMNKFAALNDFTAAFKTSSLIQLICQESDISKIVGYIDRNGGGTGISGVISYEDYSASGNEIKQNICTKLKKLKKDYRGLDGFYDDFNTAVVIYRLESANGTGGAEDVIVKYKDLFDLSTYNSTTNAKAGMLKNLTAAAQQGLLIQRNDIQEILNKKVPIEQPAGGSDSKGSGGKKSGGNNSSTVIAPAVTPVYDDTAVVKPVSGPDYGFKDLENVEWAKESIVNLAKQGIVSGYDESTFGPLDNITRAQFCKMLAKCFGIGEEATQSVFGDVYASDWYYGYVAAMKNRGIIYGDEENTFHPGAGITRQDLAVMCYRALTNSGYQTKTQQNEYGFTDIHQINEYALEAVNALAGMKVISGSEKGAFLPADNATRAEVSKIVYGLYQYMKKGGLQ